MNANLICRSLWIKRDIHGIDECNDNSKKPYVKAWCMLSIKSLKYSYIEVTFELNWQIRQKLSYLNR